MLTRDKIKFILVVFAISLILVILNFRFLQMAGADQSTYINPAAYWPNISSSWDEEVNSVLGTETISTPLIMPFVLVFKMFSFAPIIVVEYFYFTLVFSGIFLTAFYFFYVYLFKRNMTAAIFAALLYIFNLFFFVSFINFNIHLAFILLPLFFILSHRLVENDYRQSVLLIILISLISPAALINPPAVIPLIPAAGLYFLFLTFKNRAVLSFKKMAVSLIFTAILFCALNIWWLFPFFHSLYNGVASGILSGVVRMFRTTSLYDAFRFLGGWAFNSFYLGFNKGRYDSLYVNNAIFIVATYLVIICAFLSALFSKKNRNILFFMFLSLVGLFLTKGDLPPLGGIYQYAFNNLQFFLMFREPYTKFMLIYVFSISVLLGYFIYYLGQLKSVKFKIAIQMIILLAILIPSYPFFIGGFVPLRYTAGPLRSYLIKPPQYLLDYQQDTDKAKLDYRTLTTPQANGTYLWESGYITNDTVLKSFSDKTTISSLSPDFSSAHKYLVASAYDLLREGDKRFIYLISILNIKNIVQENSIDWRWAADTESPTQMNEIFTNFIHNSYIKKDQEFGKFDQEYLAIIPVTAPDQFPNGVLLSAAQKQEEENAVSQELFNKAALEIYRLDDKYFLPKFYTPQNVIMATTTIESLPTIISRPDYQIRSAVYFKDQNNEAAYDEVSSLAATTATLTLPTLEFKKINSTKYRIIIHHAQGELPLVFSESFDDGWKMYLTSFKESEATKDKILNQVQNDNEYKILDGNEEDQITTNELADYINNGWITSLGNSKEIDFVSKNFQGTIQNDDLENGNFYETWFQKPIDDNLNHQMVNGYANSWTIDPDEICLHSAQCIKNADGSYDVELVIEFWPQRLFYIGSIVSGTTLFACLSYLTLSLFRRKKRLAAMNVIKEEEYV